MEIECIFKREEKQARSVIRIEPETVIESKTVIFKGTKSLIEAKYFILLNRTITETKRIMIQGYNLQKLDVKIMYMT